MANVRFAPAAVVAAAEAERRLSNLGIKAYHRGLQSTTNTTRST